MERARTVIFDPARASVNEPDGWAFHTGGREELQFNIGIESQYERFRFGVAFSLEPSRSFPTIAPLVPKIERFDEFVRNNAHLLAPFRMWVRRKAEIIKEDTGVRQITSDEIEMPNFIFLGKSVPVPSVNVAEVLRTFDELLPLYRFVEDESIPSDRSAVFGGHAPFRFREGVTLLIRTVRRGSRRTVSM
jgi:hypothetical protein